MRKILIATSILMSLHLSAQEEVVKTSPEVKSIEGIVKEVLNIISGDKSKVRDWVAFRDLFLPTASFMVLNNIDPNKKPVETVSLDEFIQMMGDVYNQLGFHEEETGKVVQEYNGIANVFQSYYGKDSENHEERGINSYQLVYFKNRWWIANILWTGDANGVKVPGKYLSNK